MRNLQGICEPAKYRPNPVLESHFHQPIPLVISPGESQHKTIHHLLLSPKPKYGVNHSTIDLHKRPQGPRSRNSAHRIVNRQGVTCIINHQSSTLMKTKKRRLGANVSQDIMLLSFPPHSHASSRTSLPSLLLVLFLPHTAAQYELCTILILLQHPRAGPLSASTLSIYTNSQ